MTILQQIRALARGLGMSLGMSLGLTLSLSGCATASEPIADRRPADALPGPALWEVKDEDTTIYLFGTIHVLPEGVDWYDARIARAFSASGELVTELDMQDPAAISAAITAAAPLPADGNLRELMAPESRQRYEAALTGLGLPPSALDSYEPWYAALNLSLAPLLRAGFDPSTGVEVALQDRAQGKRHLALETNEQQVQMFDGMELSHQLEYLDSTVEGVNEVVPTISEMVTNWKVGDAGRLGAIMNGEIADQYLYNRLLVNRNMNWASWIEQRMAEPGTVFIAVGAGHLAGEGSVQDQLRARGLTVTRVWK
jgi:uncharacterized protein YbaP (TraB family)